MKISEKTILEAIQGFLDECDKDALARLAGDFFGGKCEYLYDDPFPNVYEFTPIRGEYQGAFGDVPTIEQTGE